MSSELMHNRSYAHRLPPTYIEQAQHYANFHEASIFAGKDMNGIEHSMSCLLSLEYGIYSYPTVASRTILRSILGAFERIVFNGDPLQLYIQEVTYQPILSLMSQTEILRDHPEMAGIRTFLGMAFHFAATELIFLDTANFASALAIELRKGDEGDSRDYLRFKFRNGTSHDFQTVHVFGKSGDIALTEFIYRLEVCSVQDAAFSPSTDAIP
jgi:hypothetical protein